jgi:hypothetical protein
MEFHFHKIKETNENVLTFQPYRVNPWSLVVWSNTEPKPFE